MPQLLGVSHMGYIYLGVTLISFSLLVTAYFNHWLQYGGIPALLFLTLDGWVFVSYGLISLGFFSLFGVSERVLGKCDALGIPEWSWFLFWPWLVPVNIFWRVACAVQNARGERISNEVFPGLHVGRKPRTAKDIPSDVTLVVDLTAEFATHPSILHSSHWKYICCPSFDTMAPSFPDLVVQTWNRMVEEEGEIYVHCAFGHGRSAAFAAAWLILKGHAKDPQEAELLMKKARPTVHLNGVQLNFLKKHLPLMKKK